jgi:hypothetical protein
VRGLPRRYLQSLFEEPALTSSDEL